MKGPHATRVATKQRSQPLGEISAITIPPAVEQTARVVMNPVSKINVGKPAPFARPSKNTNVGKARKLKRAGANTVREVRKKPRGSESGAFGGEYGLFCTAR